MGEAPLRDTGWESEALKKSVGLLTRPQDEMCVCVCTLPRSPCWPLPDNRLSFQIKKLCASGSKDSPCVVYEDMSYSVRKTPCVPNQYQ